MSLSSLHGGKEILWHGWRFLCYGMLIELYSMAYLVNLSQENIQYSRLLELRSRKD